MANNPFLQLLENVGALSRKPYKTVYGNFINENNTPAQWVGRVVQDVQQRGLQELPHDLSYPITKSPLVEPWLEPLISNTRMTVSKIPNQEPLTQFLRMILGLPPTINTINANQYGR